MRLSVDTNAYRALVDGDPQFVAAIQKAEVVAFSAVVLGELHAGFKSGTKQLENEELLSRVLARHRVVVHPIGASTSSLYGAIWSGLRRTGHPIPSNDIWIAAQCLEYEFTLLTRDSHFRYVDNLDLYPAVES